MIATPARTEGVLRLTEILTVCLTESLEVSAVIWPLNMTNCGRDG